MFIAAVSFALALVAASPIAAHDLGYRWSSSKAQVHQGSTSYETAIKSSAANYDSYTDLTVSYTAYPGSINAIFFFQENNGPGFLAVAVAYSNGNACAYKSTAALTGYCNTSDRKANYGEVYINTYYTSEINTKTNWLMRHEMGHLFGMQHGPCDEGSVMQNNCGTLYGSLTGHDINTMNSWY
jgi:hypothetical protein